MVRDFVSIGKAVRDLLAELDGRPYGEVVIDLAERRARIADVKGSVHATDLGPVEGGSAFVIPWTKITRCAGMIGQRS